MASTTPPPVTTTHDEARYRTNVKVLQIAICTLTIVVNVWLLLVHPLLGVAALFLTKHILVAILAAGLNLPLHRIPPPETPGPP